jgi:hypothetical protein
MERREICFHDLDGFALWPSIPDILLQQSSKSCAAPRANEPQQACRMRVFPIHKRQGGAPHDVGFRVCGSSHFSQTAFSGLFFLLLCGHLTAPIHNTVALFTHVHNVLRRILTYLTTSSVQPNKTEAKSSAVV